MGVLPVVAATRGYSLVAVHELFIAVASLVADHRLQGTCCSVVAAHGLVALQHVESSGTRNRTHVPYIGRWILIYWTTRE